jgi:hypothetical protein
MQIHERSTRWREYLNEVAADERLSANQRTALAEAWTLIVAAESGVSFPNAGVDDAGTFYFGWNTPLRTLDIEFRTDGTGHWFFSDHRYGLVLSSEDGHGDHSYRALLALFRRHDGG